jgi:hypothetical protein
VSADNFATNLAGFDDLAVAGTSQSVTGLTANTTYKYRVRAVNAGGTSANSNEITQLTLTDAPVAAAASDIAETSFTANWGAVTGATGYRLDVATDAGFTALVAGYSDKAVAGTSDAVIGLAAGTNYFYRVRAENAAGPSANSNTITQIAGVPVAPTLLSAAPTGTTGELQITFTLNANNNDGETDVEYSLDNGAWISAGTTTSPFTITGLVGNQLYNVRVRALNTRGPSAPSNTVSGTPDA